MKDAAKIIEGLSEADIVTVVGGGSVSIEVAGNKVELNTENLVIQRSEKEGLKVMNEDSLTVALDPHLTPELIEEGMIRDLVRGIQNLRKENGFEVTDRISLKLFGEESMKAAIEKYKDYIFQETLSESWQWEQNGDSQAIDCGESECFCSMTKV
jgi:isoleucyl-tRNA synthetase